MAYKNFTAKLNSTKGFYIGDLCYVLADDDYYGEWSNDFTDLEGEHEIRGHRFAVAATMYGDGEYCDNEGQFYGVDAGNIAIVPLELCKTQDEEQLLKLGNVVRINEAEMEADNGVITIDLGNDRTIVINTTEEEYEEERVIIEQGERAALDEMGEVVPDPKDYTYRHAPLGDCDDMER